MTPMVALAPLALIGTSFLVRAARVARALVAACVPTFLMVSARVGVPAVIALAFLGARSFIATRALVRTRTMLIFARVSALVFVSLSIIAPPSPAVSSVLSLAAGALVLVPLPVFLPPGSGIFGTGSFVPTGRGIVVRFISAGRRAAVGLISTGRGIVMGLIFATRGAFVVPIIPLALVATPLVIIVSLVVGSMSFPSASMMPSVHIPLSTLPITAAAVFIPLPVLPATFMLRFMFRSVVV